MDVTKHSEVLKENNTYHKSLTAKQVGPKCRNNKEGKTRAKMWQYNTSIQAYKLLVADDFWICFHLIEILMWCVKIDLQYPWTGTI